MGDKVWKYTFQVRRYPRTVIFGYRVEAYCFMPGWPSISLFVHFWHRTYRFWLYKMGGPRCLTKPGKPSSAE